MSSNKLITFILVFFLTFALFIFPLNAADNWHSSDHKARFLFLVNHNYIEEDMADFPLLFKATSESDSYWESKGNDDGNDLRIFTIDGIECPYEVVKYDPINYEYIVYFKAPLVKRLRDTEFYIYTAYDGNGNFDDPKNVWKNAAGIYHLEDGTDSLGVNNATPMNGAIPSGGAVGKGYKLNGVNQYLDAGNPDFNFTDKLTVMAWAKWLISPTPPPAQQWANIVSIHDNTASADQRGQFGIQHNSDNSRFEFAVFSDSQRRFRPDSTVSIQRDQWYFVVGRYNGNIIDIHVNANYGGQTSITGTNIRPYTSTFQTNIGRRATQTPGRYFNGVIDEVWIFKDVKSYPFIKAVYNNATDYNNFTSRSPPEKIPEAIIINITKPDLRVVRVSIGELILLDSSGLNGESTITGEHITKEIYNGNEVSAVRFSRGTHDVTLNISNFGMFTQRDVNMRVEGLPEGASAVFTPKNQTLRTKETVSFNARCTIGPNVPAGVYKYKLILYNNLGVLGQREIFLFVE